MIGTKVGRRKTPDPFRCIKICSWNVRGVREVCKKQAIFSMGRTGDVRILCLQETHLDKGTVSALKNSNYHSTHTSFKGGECIDKLWVGFPLQRE